MENRNMESNKSEGIFDKCAEESIEEYLGMENETELTEYTEYTDHSERGNGKVINEEMVEVIFSTIKSVLKVNVSGNLIFFKFEFLSDRSIFTLRVRKTTFSKFFSWINRINEIVMEGK